MAQYFASCPFCNRVHEHEADAPRITVDGRVRIVCEHCVSRMTSATLPTKPNGEVRK
jgi:hypothetical protein